MFAYDRLKVLRRVNQNFDIHLYLNDLKTLWTKEKRLELTKDIPEDQLHNPVVIVNEEP
jgi:hypothetical protein